MLSATALIAESSFGCCDQRACGDAGNYRLPLHSANDDEGAAMIDKSHITGLVLAGGRGSRMGGVDKGLQPHLGMPLAMHALLRLAPQVGETMINANRNLGAYESLGAAVWPDALPDYPGPLAGFLAGLEHCATPYLATVPCALAALSRRPGRPPRGCGSTATTPRSRWRRRARTASCACSRCSA